MKKTLLFLAALCLFSCDLYQPMEKIEKIVEIIPEEIIPVPPETFTVRVDQNTGGQASIQSDTEPPGANAYIAGSFIRLSAEPHENYRFLCWKGTLENSPCALSNPLVLAVTRSEWIIPVFERIPEPEPEPPAPVEVEYTVSIDQVTGGTVTRTPSQTTYRAGDYVKIEAACESGYRFAGWSGTLASSSDNATNPFVLTVTRSEWIIPVFERIPEPEPEPPAPVEVEYTVSIDQVTGGTVTRTPSQTTYRAGDYVKIEAACESGYRFAGWSGTLASSSDNATNPFVLTVTRSEWIIPVFERIPEPEPDPPAPVEVEYTLKIDVTAGGTVTINPNKPTYKKGEMVFINVSPRSNYIFEGWSGSVTGKARELFLTVSADMWMKASFTYVPPIEKVSLNITTYGRGSVEANPSKTEYDVNEKITLTARPDAQSVFTSWGGALSGSTAVATITLAANTNVTATFADRQWTWLIYMAADNDLEAAAIGDLNELEAAIRPDAPATVLALVDRHPGYDASNGNWADTRLIELKNDPNGVNNVLILPRVESPLLGLSPTQTSELDLANPQVLRFALADIRDTYPAAHYGLIVWGHGSGWKGTASAGEGAGNTLKAFAFDDTSSTHMCLSQLGTAVSERVLDIIGFDTCFASLLETAYELRTGARYLIGSIGATPTTGWDYEEIFGSFLSGDFSLASFTNAAVSSFQNQYGGVPRSSITVIDQALSRDLFTAFEALCASAAQAVTGNQGGAQLLRNTLIDSGDLYHYPTFPCDSFLDIGSFARESAAIADTITANASLRTAIKNRSQALLTALDRSVPLYWSADSPMERKIGVHLVGFTAPFVPSPWHDAGYVKGSGAENQSSFVRDSSAWVPNYVSSTSLLDLLFHTIY